MKSNIFTNKKYVVILALIAMFGWGLAYPFIKLGMKEFNIAADDTGGRMLFAGVRFFTAGLLTMCIAAKRKQPVVIKNVKLIGLLFVFGIFNTALHYFCFYTGLAHCEGGKASIINSMDPFFLIILASIIFKEKLTGQKIFGCVLGFAGILIVNLGVNMSGFSFMGEGMILLNGLFSAIGGILSRVVTKKVAPVTATGYSLGLGGLLLIIAGLACGGRFTTFTFMGLVYLLGLITISMVGFIIYNNLICYNPINEIAIFKVLIPIFGTMLSCLMLGESLTVNSVIALIIIGIGIASVNAKSKTANK